MSVDRAEAAVLVLPGLNGSGPRHWQSIWERRDRALRRVEQACWREPRLCDWAFALERAVASAQRPVILVAHSLACALVAHWARAGAARNVAAALLVAPADVEALSDRPIHGFSPLPLEPLPFSTWVVASEDDRCCKLERARAFARAWAARFLEAGRCGHINAESGHGAWPEGEALLQRIRAAARLSGGSVPAPVASALRAPPPLRRDAS